MTRKIATILAGLALAVPVAACGSGKSSGTGNPRGAASTASGSPAAGNTGAPAFDPVNFVRRVDNPYFPLTPGTTLRYRGVRDGRRVEDVFSVTNRVRVIQGVQATVVIDRLYANGRLAEDTVDWYGQDRQGNVWYLGEATRELDRNGRTTSTEGSWLTGRDGARPGIFMPPHPRVGQTFQQEFFRGHAEDHFRVRSLAATVHVPFTSSRTALLTEEWTPLEPAVVDNKYYVRGIGTVLEQAVKGGQEHLELVSVSRR